MTRSLKALGIGFVAVLAMGAVLASAAQAAKFKSAETLTVLTGETEAATGGAVFEPVPGSGLAVTCTNGKYEGTEEGKELTSVTVHPTYTGCTLAGKAATVNTHKCHYKLFALTEPKDEPGNMAAVEINECPEAEQIDISVPELGVTLHVKNQTIKNAVSYANVGTPGSVTVTATATGISFTCTPKATCLASLGASSGTTATYTDHVLTNGFKDTEKGTTGNYHEGAQIKVSYE